MSKVISDGQQYWRDIEGHPNSITHTSLSNRFLGRKVNGFLVSKETVVLRWWER